MSICILCGSNAIINWQESASRTIYNCPKCGVFVISELVENEVKKNADELAAYLMMRKLAKKSDTVLISYDKANLDKDYLRVVVDRIVSFFPATFSEQMDLALKNLEYMSEFAGYEIKIDDIKSAPIFYVRGQKLAALLYFVRSMCEAGLVEVNSYAESGFPFGVTITPKGWERLEGLKNGKAGRKNIFAYTPSAAEEINTQFCESYKSLEKSLKGYGYNLINSTGSQEYTKIRLELDANIKASEIVICDLSDNTAGGYYAVAMARALGKICILTCHESAKKKLQIDTSQYWVILWDTQENLSPNVLTAIKAML